MSTMAGPSAARINHGGCLVSCGVGTSFVLVLGMQQLTGQVYWRSISSPDGFIVGMLVFVMVMVMGMVISCYDISLAFVQHQH
jgi:hypothetical protein